MTLGLCHARITGGIEANGGGGVVALVVCSFGGLIAWIAAVSGPILNEWGGQKKNLSPLLYPLSITHTHSRHIHHTSPSIPSPVFVAVPRILSHQVHSLPAKRKQKRH